MHNREPTPFNIPFDFGGEKLYESKFEETTPDYRFVRPAQAENYQILKPEHIAGYFKEYVFNPFDQFTQEELWILMCDTHNVVMYDALVYRGTINTVYIRPAEIFRPAIYYNSASIVMSHCHPSGSSVPSNADIQITEKLVGLGKELDLPILDHVIVGRNDCASLAMKGLGGL